MNRAEELYQKVMHLPEGEKNKFIAEYMKKVDEDEFVQQLMEFADDTMNHMKQLEKDVIAFRTKWLNEKWINKSDICYRLYGKADKSTVGYFTQQRQGKKPWKPEQLKRLDEIRKELMESLKV